MHKYTHTYIHSYRYHTIIDACTTALLPIKPSSDDDSGFRHGFRAEGSLPFAQSAPAVSHDTTSLCQIVVTLWDCHIHADGGSPRLNTHTYTHTYIYMYTLNHVSYLMLNPVFIYT